jgi:hypothetical protein
MLDSAVRECDESRVAPEQRASFRPVRRRRPPPTKRSFYADEGASPDCIESRTCE